MSDYLSNLAARSLKQTEIVKPRLASLFEPRASVWPLLAAAAPEPQPSGDTNMLEEIESETTPSMRPPSHATIAIHRESPGDFKQAPATLANQGDQSAQQLPDARPELPSSQTPAPKAPFDWEQIESNREKAFNRAEENAQAPSPHRMSEQVSPNAKRELTGIAPDESRISPQEHIKSIGRDAAAAPPQFPRERRAEPSVESSIRHSVIERIIMPLQPSPPAASKLEPRADDANDASANRSAANHAVVARPRVIPYVERPAPVLSEPEPPSSPMPNIQVTIGRIEVRATPQPAQQRQGRRASSPVMNLDEYLRQRSGGSQ
jgi:hypothetical protein